jgi:hypothetical protein
VCESLQLCPGASCLLCIFFKVCTSCDNVAISFFGGGGGRGLRRLSTSVMEQNAVVIHSFNIFDHSKDFLAFFTSSTLLINVSLSIRKYSISYLQLLRLIPTTSIKFNKHHFFDSYWPSCWLFQLAYLIYIHAHIRHCLQGSAIMARGPWKWFIVGIWKVKIRNQRKRRTTATYIKYFKDVSLPDGSLTYINVLSKNRPPHSQTRSRVNKHGGENKDL